MNISTLKTDPRVDFWLPVVLVVLATIAAAGYLDGNGIVYLSFYVAVLGLATSPGRRLFLLATSNAPELIDEGSKTQPDEQVRSQRVQKTTVRLCKDACISELETYRQLVLDSYGERPGSCHASSSAFDELIQIRKIDFTQFPTVDVALSQVNGCNGEPSSRIKKLYYGKYPPMYRWLAKLDSKHLD